MPFKVHGNSHEYFFFHQIIDWEISAIFVSILIESLVITSHSAYVATSTELHEVKIDGYLYPNLCRFQKC